MDLMRFSLPKSLLSLLSTHRSEGLVFHAQFYAPQTKILEGGTKDDIRIFD
jgi:hypothetical protein